MELDKFEVEPAYREKLDKVKKDYLQQGLPDLVVRMIQWKAMKIAAEKELETANLHLEAFSELIQARMEEQQLHSFKTAHGDTIYISSTAYPSVKDREKLFAWIKKKKMVTLLSIHHQTLKGICNDLLREGEDVPPGVKCFIKSSIRLKEGK